MQNKTKYYRTMDTREPSITRSTEDVNGGVVEPHVKLSGIRIVS